MCVCVCVCVCGSCSVPWSLIVLTCGRSCVYGVKDPVFSALACSRKWNITGQDFTLPKFKSSFCGPCHNLFLLTFQEDCNQTKATNWRKATLHCRCCHHYQVYLTTVKTLPKPTFQRNSCRPHLVHTTCSEFTVSFSISPLPIYLPLSLSIHWILPVYRTLTGVDTKWIQEIYSPFFHTSAHSFCVNSGAQNECAK